MTQKTLRTEKLKLNTKKKHSKNTQKNSMIKQKITYTQNDKYKGAIILTMLLITKKNKISTCTFLCTIDYNDILKLACSVP